jgi:hypothetical protein
MSYDKLIQEPKLTFDRQRIRQGGDVLANYVEELLAELEERLRDVNRYANHFRQWIHASDFDTFDGAHHYAGSITTAAAALNAWTDPQSALTVETTPIGENWTTEQTLSFNSKGAPIVIFWGAQPYYISAPTTVQLRLYRDAVLLQTIGPLLTVAGTGPVLNCVYLDEPDAGNVVYTLQAACAAGGQVELANRYIVVVECKR